MRPINNETSRTARVPATAVILALAAVSTRVHALDVHHVPGDFATLQAAINAAAPGDTIVLDGGTHLYTEIASSLTIVGRASSPPLLSVNGTGVGGFDQDPPVVVEPDGGVVTLVGVEVSGTNYGITSGNVPGISASGSGHLRILHSTIRAPEWQNISEEVYGRPGISASGLTSFLAVDSLIQASDNDVESTVACVPGIKPGDPGLSLNVGSAVVLDSTLLGGDSYQPIEYHTMACYQPESCDELFGGQGGPGCKSATSLRVANTLSLGGMGALAQYDDINPPGFPCSFPDGVPFEAPSVLALDDGATLSGSGPAIENSGWSLHWFVEAPSILAIGPALLEPVQHPAGLLFMDPDKLILRPVPNIGPGSKTFAIGALDESLYGQVLGFQLFSPAQGLSRPVLAAVQPE